MPSSVNSSVDGRLIPAIIIVVEKRVVSREELDLTQLKQILTKSAEYMDNWTPDQILDELIRLLNETYPALKDYTSIVVFYITVKRALSISSYFN